jgi:hypothetical protein
MKWNFDEFRVTYSTETELIKVWKYYLVKLLSEGNE